MSVVSVRARSFILALFIRDDGERFLLGDRGFDFKDSQLHFSANTIENDEVEKQGVDGVMLAGQVRRASVQSFDGYVGDGTTLKEEVERMRRDFIAFFAKGHHFRVIYIDCNRNAWQRKGGYLVDAPEVKELWQIHPEYHVGLNFEDVNYYEYDENAEGEEILSNIISVPISSDVEGGLVWDENGAVSEPEEIEYDTETATASGNPISIADAVEAPLADFKLKGETSQNGTPTPDAPVAVQTVTGENTLTISDGTSAQSYEVDLGSIELCKIGAYQDYVWNDNGTWKVHKAIIKYTFNGSENWTSRKGDNVGLYQLALAETILLPASSSAMPQVLSSHFKADNNNRVWASNGNPCFSAVDGSNPCVLRFSKGEPTNDLAAWKTWLGSNNVSVYAILATPTDTEITNETLVAQLEAILSQGYTYAGTNNITTVIAAGNAQGELEITYYTKYNAKVVGGGYVWEAGGSGGPTIVTNESISAVSPVWTVFGPALNPMLENTTTGEQIQYVGMISEGQTLVVDMGEQTASLDGLNVISNIVGEYLTLAPGSNTLLFSADSDAPASEIGWSEIVG